MGHPGTLPTVNKEAVKHVLRVGVALGGTLATYTEFDRKNYFYPDIPKGYQISQYQYPLVSGGSLVDVAITRVHLEEDTARSLHDQGAGSLIDYNRAGVPLMELVTEPVIHDAKTAGAFARELQLLLRTLGVSDANMEKGEMRVEANISISSDETFGTKVEVKNLNSFRSVESAIEYEIKRQAELLKTGEAVIQETRGWDEVKGRTYAQRKKESSHDYRYFPDPDIPKMSLESLEEFSITRLSETMPELPKEKRLKYENLGLPSEQIETIVLNVQTSKFFDSVVPKLTEAPEKIRIAANYLTSDILGFLSKESEKTIADAHEEAFVELINLIYEKTLTSRVAKDILIEVVFEGKSPQALAEERGLLQVNSEDDLMVVVDGIIAEHKEVVDEYKNGKEASLQYLIGQGMRLTKGSANPVVLKDLLIRRIK